MSDDYETARHYGFSREDYMSEQKEIMDRMEFLGCPICKYGGRESATCTNIINDECGIYKCGCPLYSKKEEEKQEEVRDAREAIWDYIIERGIATEGELQLATSLKGYSVETLYDVLFIRTGNRDMTEEE